MFAIKKICVLLILLSVIAGATVYAQTKDAANNPRKLHGSFYIGFYRGSQYFDLSKGSGHNKYCGSNTGFIVRLPIANRFKIETGLLYNNIQGPKPNQSNSFLSINQMLRGTNYFSLPLSLQYYLRQQNKKLQPFFGAGSMITPYQQKSRSIINDGGQYAEMPGTKYMSLFLMQGLTYKISTKIEVTESIHFMPQKDNNSIGVGVGIGFRLP